MSLEKGFESLFEAPSSYGGVGVRGRCPGGAEGSQQSGFRHTLRQLLYQRSRSLRRVGKADGASLEYGFGEGGVRRDRAQGRVHGGG